MQLLRSPIIMGAFVAAGTIAGAARCVAADHPLVDLAREQFAQLTEVEQRLYEAVAAGQVLDLSESDDGRNDVAKGGTWPVSRSVKVEHLAWLCNDPVAKELVTTHGIRIRGARIERSEKSSGLEAIEVLFDVALTDCYLPHALNIGNSTVRDLDLSGSFLAGGLQADDLKIVKSFTAIGCTFIGPVELRRLAAAGSVDFSAANIEGGVHLPNARIKGDVRFTDSILLAQADESAPGPALSLNLDLARIGGTVYLDGSDEQHRFRSQGSVRLVLAQLDGNLDCFGGAIESQTDEALYCNGLQVGGSVILAGKFTCRGKISFRTGRVAHYLTFYELDGGAGPAFGDAELDLQALHVGTLNCDTLDWVKPGRLALNGFVYDRIELVKQVGDKEIQLPLRRDSLLNWLQSQNQNPFFPQPYEQLAEVLQREGYDDAARPILIQKEEELGMRSEWGLRNVAWFNVFGPMIGYGYNPLHGLRWLFGIWLLGGVVFWLAYRSDRMAPVMERSDPAAPITATELARADHPKFQPLMYSLDLLAPLLELGQTQSWRPRRNMPGSGAMQWYHWGHAILGWTLTTLVVAGLTGLIRT